MRLRRPETHILTGAYAMHALTGADAARFERHLARCPACAAEVSEFAEATARLAAAARTRQLPPATARPLASRPARPVAWPARPASLLRRPGGRARPRDGPAGTPWPRRWRAAAAGCGPRRPARAA